MKKIFISFLSVCLLFTASCSGESFKNPEITSDKYVIETKSKNGVRTPLLYVKAYNIVGEVNIAIEGSDVVTIENENLQSYIETYLQTPENSTLEVINKLNYVNLMSDNNLVASYNSTSGMEFIFPDMILEDGSLKKSFKYRKTFDKIFLRLSRSLANNLGMDIYGELKEERHTFSHKIVDGKLLIYLDKESLAGLTEFLPLLGVNDDVIDVITSITSQYRRSSEILEVGMYFNSIE